MNRKKVAIGAVVVVIVAGLALLITTAGRTQRLYYPLSAVEGWLGGIPDPADRSRVAVVLQAGLNAWIPDFEDVAFMKLEDMGPEGVIALGKALKYGRTRARESASWLLCRRRRAAEPVLPEVIEALSDPSDTVRSRSAHCLGNIGPPAKEALPALRALLNDPFWQVRFAAAESLYDIGSDERGVPLLREGLDSPDGYVRIAAASGLVDIGRSDGKVEETILEIFRGGYDEHIREQVMGSLGKLARESASSRKALVRALDDPYWYVADQAADQLIRNGTDREAVLGFLKRWLSADSFGLRAGAAKKLGALGEEAREAVPELEAALADEDQQVREAAAGALKKIRGKTP